MHQDGLITASVHSTDALTKAVDGITRNRPRCARLRLHILHRKEQRDAPVQESAHQVVEQAQLGKSRDEAATCR